MYRGRVWRAGFSAGSCGAGGESESSQGRKVGATVMALAGLAHQCSLLALTDVLQLLQKTFKQVCIVAPRVLIGIIR